MLSSTAALGLAKQLMVAREGERPRLERLLSYRRTGVGPSGVFSSGTIAGLPADMPREVRQLAKVSRVNLLRYVVSSRVQDMYVEGFQTPDSPEDVPSWGVWQANGLDARQIGVHRSALTFGSSYVVVLPGSPAPVLRGVSPRDMTVLYRSDDVWPVAALWRTGSAGWRLLDDTHVYEFVGSGGDSLRFLASFEHGAEFTPVVRFRDTNDLDVDVEGVVEPLIDLQDQINVTSFGLHVAQHYGAFRQRYILGWVADSEAEALKTGASKMMMFEDTDVTIGEFGQTDLRGYIESREATIRHLATVSQTPVHELMGQMINLSAEALEAAKASHHAAVEENRVAVGESWEQVLRLASELGGDGVVDDSASVIWRDTTMRSLGEAADALGLLTEKLGVPPKALWSRIPGASQHEIELWTRLAEEPGAFDNLMSILERQSSPTPVAASE